MTQKKLGGKQTSRNMVVSANGVASAVTNSDDITPPPFPSLPANTRGGGNQITGRTLSAELGWDRPSSSSVAGDADTLAAADDDPWPKTQGKRGMRSGKRGGGGCKLHRFDGQSRFAARSKKASPPHAVPLHHRARHRCCLRPSPASPPHPQTRLGPPGQKALIGCPLPWARRRRHNPCVAIKQ